MADGSKIEWTEATWNPITGCSVASPGCTNCYAMKLAGTRMQHHWSRKGLTVDTKAGPVWTGEVRFNEEWLTQPLQWKRPRLIFVCAHADLFHEAVPDEWIDRIFAVMALAPQHTFQVLTKRADRMRSYISHDARLAAILDAMDRTIPRGSGSFSTWPLPNVWLGVSAEDQQRADERIPHLLATPAAVRWVSAEPLLGPVDARQWLHDYGCSACGHGGYVAERCRECGWHGSNTHQDGPCPECGEQLQDDYACPQCGEPDGEGDFGPTISGHRLGLIDWVVVGGESGPNARPMHPDWARSLRDQCADAGVAFHFKQWGEWRPDIGVDTFNTAKGRNQHTPAFIIKNDGTVHCFLPTDEQRAPVVLRVGKRAAGRLLDGVQHDGMPEVRS